MRTISWTLCRTQSEDTYPLSTSKQHCIVIQWLPTLMHMLTDAMHTLLGATGAQMDPSSTPKVQEMPFENRFLDFGQDSQ